MRKTQPISVQEVQGVHIPLLLHFTIHSLPVPLPLCRSRGLQHHQVTMNEQSTSLPTGVDLASCGLHCKGDRTAQFVTMGTYVASPLPSTISPLKGRDDFKHAQKCCMGASQTDHHCMNGTQLTKRGLVRFSEAVAVFFIPRRSDYPEELRRSMFLSKKEISANAARNMLEFASEGFDWRKVAEDEDMYIDRSGRRVHPIHLPRIWAERQSPSPAKPNLPRPKPHRPMHPSRRVSSSQSERHKDVPFDRSATPAPILSADGVLVYE
jgi:hypothetical protein